MSQLTHPRAQILDLSFRLRTWMAVAAAVVAVAIPTALVVSSDDDPAQGNQPSASGLRYDGGPDEGTRGLATQPGVYTQSERGSDTLGARR